jgi:sensor histidine kinase YesM
MNPPFMKIPIITKQNLVSIGLHSGAWLIIFSLPYLLRLIYLDDPIQNPEQRGFFLLGLYTGVLWAITFYLNAFYFLPKMVRRKQWALFITSIVVLYIIMLNIHGIIFRHLIPLKPFNIGISALFNAPAYLLSLAVSTIYYLVNQNIRESRFAREKHEETLKTELAFLRSQISPHFLFNVLNNIVALARLKSDKLEPTVHKLSSLMQYMLYETTDETVLLRKEIEYLESYVQLQEQRFGEKVRVKLLVDAKDDFYEIEPMLLIPFVENAFKHGVGLIEHPEINISLHVKDGQLTFYVQNKYNAGTTEEKDKASGIGLNNVERRLDLLYKKDHTLSVNKRINESNENIFEVFLQIHLHK